MLAELVATCRELAGHLTPFLPGPAARIAGQCGTGDTVGEPTPIFPRLERAALPS